VLVTPQKSSKNLTNTNIKVKKIFNQIGYLIDFIAFPKSHVIDF